MKKVAQIKVIVDLLLKGSRYKERVINHTH